MPTLFELIQHVAAHVICDRWRVAAASRTKVVLRNTSEDPHVICADFVRLEVPGMKRRWGRGYDVTLELTDWREAQGAFAVRRLTRAEEAARPVTDTPGGA